MDGWFRSSKRRIGCFFFGEMGCIYLRLTKEDGVQYVIQGEIFEREILRGLVPCEVKTNMNMLILEV